MNKDPKSIITINEKVNLTKTQYEVLKTICDTYEQSLSEYMQEALVEAMKYDIEEGNFSDVLLEKLNQDDDKEKNPYSSSTSSVKNELDALQKQQEESFRLYSVVHEFVRILKLYAMPFQPHGPLHFARSRQGVLYQP